MSYKTDAEIMQELIEGRNNKPTNNPIEPEHYNKGEIDLFEAWSKIYPKNEFRAGMEMIAMRYMFRDKENKVQDLDKAIYTLERLKEYEILEEEE